MAKKCASSPLFQNDFTCSVCLEVFTDPKLLPCSHSFCLKCLEDLVNSGPEMLCCPQCRRQITVPAGGVATLQTNFYINPADLEKARNGKLCQFHPKMDLAVYCLDCNGALCYECTFGEHKTHTTMKLLVNDDVEETRAYIGEQQKVLEETMLKNQMCIDFSREELTAIESTKKVLETAIRTRHEKIVSNANSFRDKMLADLDALCSVLQTEVSSDLTFLKKMSYTQCLLLHELKQLKINSPVFCIGDSLDLTTIQKAFKNNLDKIYPKRKIKRPCLIFKYQDVVFDEKLKKVLSASLTTTCMIAEVTEVTVKADYWFRKGINNDVLSVCPSDEAAWITYAEHGQENKPSVGFKNCLKKEKAKCVATSLNVPSADDDGRLYRETVFRYRDNISVYSKSQSRSYCAYSSKIVETKVCYINALQRNLVLKPEEFEISLHAPQRAFDVDGTQELFVVLEESRALDTRRCVYLYRPGQREAVAIYTPPSTVCQPSDVCFFTLGGQELLMVADEGTDSIHVVKVESSAFTFLRYLAAGHPLLMRPSALNKDNKGSLWVACKSGAILTMTPVAQ